MTRWARGSGANRKKPLDASKWTEMMSDATDANTDTVSAVQVKRTSKQSLPKKLKHKSCNKQKSKELSNNLQQNVIDELEKLRKESSLTENVSESIVLEEFVRKDARREARRLKRQEQKRQTRVCLTCWVCFIHSFIRGGGWPLAVFRRAFQPTANAEA